MNTYKFKIYTKSEKLVPELGCSLNLQDCIDKQWELNDIIFKKFNITQIDIEEELILALKVELSELANETLCFKYWKEDKLINQEKVYEELADVFHFLLSIIIRYEVEDMISMEFQKVPKTQYTQTYLFNKMYRKITDIENSKEGRQVVHIQDLINYFIQLSKSVGINEDMLMRLYDKKYEKNVERQNQGY